MYRALFLGSLLVVGACRHAPPVVAAPQGAQRPVDTTVARGPDAAATRAAVEQVLANFSRVHFETDQATLSAEARAILAENARILTAHPSIKVEVQGHADGRGTVDYNLALGERRAEAVVRALTAMGVAPSRVGTISYGEERPLAAGDTEVAWSENRRCEFRVTAGTEAVGTTRS